MEWTQEKEEKAQNWLKKQELKDPLFKERQEFGKMLFRHIDDFTPEERERYDDLRAILANANTL